MRQIEVVSIQPQRDQFVVKGKHVDDIEFWTSRMQATDVAAFKRFVVECTVNVNGQQYPFTIIFNARSHFVRVLAKGVPLKAQMLAESLVRILRLFRRLGTLPVVHATDDFFEFAMDDALWAVAALHDLRERGGFPLEGTLDNRFSVFDFFP